MTCKYDEKVKRTRPSFKKKPAICIDQVYNHEEDSQRRISDQKFRIGDLRQLTFVNDLYEPFRMEQNNNNKNGIRAHLKSTSLPPLLFDFFNLSAQPYSIWTSFTKLFQLFLRSPSQTQHPSDLANEVLALFDTYNCLYSTFINIDTLTKVLDRFPIFFTLQKQQPQPAIDPPGLLLLIIFALVFHAAHQSLPVSANREMAENLHKYAHQFYREARRQFVEFVFPPEPLETDVTWIVQASVLLTHFQCVAVCPNQAFVTLRMGAALAEQCQQNEQHNTSPSWLLTQKILHGWNTWFALYLWTDYVEGENEDDCSYSQLEDGLGFDQDVHAGRKGNQRWAIRVLDHYMYLFRDLLRRRYDDHVFSSDIKGQLGTLEKLCASFDDESPVNLPTAVLALYHNVLTIQLFGNHCYDRHSDLLIPKSSDKQTKNEPVSETSRSLSISSSDPCTDAAQRIVQIAKNLVHDYCMTRARGQEGVIPSAMLYPICLAATVFIWRLQLPQDPAFCGPNTTSTTTTASAATASAAASAGKKPKAEEDALMFELMPVFQLRSLLKIVQTQIDAAGIVVLHLNGALLSTNRISPELLNTHETAGHGSLSLSAPDGPEDGEMPQKNRVLNQMAHFQAPNVMCRRDIDREQLDKLSVNSKDLRDDGRKASYRPKLTTTATVSTTASPANATRRRHTMPRAHAVPSHPQKRHNSFPADLHQQMQPPEMPSSKRLRIDSSLSDGHDTSRSYPSQLDFFRSSERARNIGYMGLPDLPAEALDMYPAEYLFMTLRMQDQIHADTSQNFYRERPSASASASAGRPRADAAGLTTSTSTSSHSSRSSSSNGSNNSNSSSSGSSSSNSSIIGGTTTIPPKLPLPAPKQSTLPAKKHWSTRDWNQCFTESIMETLHQNTPSIHLEPSYTGMEVVSDSNSALDPTTVLVTQTPQTDPSTIAENSMVYLICPPNNTTGRTGQDTAPCLTASTWMASKPDKKRPRTPSEAWMNTTTPPSIYPPTSSLGPRISDDDENKVMFPQDDHWIQMSPTAKMANDMFW
ncbi:hypothetical protein DFQ28_000288 [Apophysomyces sp. BC1034]|nr:hypothetical protein DFQ30_008107 [Apophysomyces sp. BC1015]KAG0191402.1 hypothetical protein DFQ28_000288 [Apophysomyces sp. BC1034]